jgi:hypothetical protein
MNQELLDELEAIEIKTGDIVVDHMAGYVGILLSRTRRVDIVIDDVYFWEVQWTSRFGDKQKRNNNNPLDVEITGLLEEETLKLSILVGAIEIFSGKKDE